MRTLLIVLALLAWTPSAHAADVLFVSDGRSDLNIPDALRVDGHDVTVALDDYVPATRSNPALMGDLGAYDCVVWSSSREGLYTHRDETYTNLTRYVSGGGRLFITGFFSLGADEALPRFVGGVSSSWNAGTPLSVATIENSLTTGVIDIRAVIPDPYEVSYNGVGGLGSDVQVVVIARSGFGTEAPIWTLRQVGLGEIAYVANGAASGETHPSWTNTASAGPGAYNAALRNFVYASEAPTAGAPRVRFTAEDTVDEGTLVTFRLDVLDAEGDTYEIAWDVDGDGFDDAIGARSVERLAADGEGWLEVSARAVDALGHVTERTRRAHVLNVDPWAVSTPPTTVSIGENVAYRLFVDDPAGALDTTTLELTAGPASATLEEGVFHYVPTAAEVTGESRFIACEIVLTDEDGGRSVHAWQMHVVGNHAPTDLSLESPIDDAMADAMPRLTVRDGTDLDGDPLQYFFEVDVVDTFDSPALVASGPIDEVPGFTRFDLSEPLVGGRYYWRAWLTDGTTITAPRSSTFVIGGALASDAGVRSDGGDVLAPMTTRGCSCTASSSGAPSTLWLLALGTLILGRLRRRR